MIKPIEIKKINAEISKGVAYDFGEGQELVIDVIDLPQRIWIKTECRNLHYTSKGELIESIPKRVYKVLITDDDPDFSEVLSEVVSISLSHSHNSIACNGQEALEFFVGNYFDLIVTDYRMPIKDGDWFIKEVRKINSKIPIILITGFTDIVLSKEEFYTDSNLYIHPKPFDEEKFNEIIRGVMDIR